ncbi:MAG: ion channel [Proteobacteria bacterium]|nr:ion channel [Pseudomonadota bacterium]
MAKNEKSCERQIIFNGRPLLIRGIYVSKWSDIYYFFLSARWPTLFVILAAFYIIVNGIFAGLYLLGGDCILNARPGSLWDAFFFSVQTWATIGYGAMAPKTHYADILVAIESFSGLLSMSIVTGLVFAKFARPRSKVRFTQKILMSRFDGKNVLMLRLGNMRGNQIVEAKIRVVYAAESKTAEGQMFRRLLDLQLIRDSNALFSLTWQVMHVIDESSPLWQLTQSEFVNRKAQIIVSMAGTDEEFNQTVHARHIYGVDNIEWHQRFDDILTSENGVSVIDYQKFDHLVPLVKA